MHNITSVYAHKKIRRQNIFTTDLPLVAGHADRVLVLEHGRIVEDGPPADLISGDGQYAALHEAWLRSLA